MHTINLCSSSKYHSFNDGKISVRLIMRTNADMHTSQVAACSLNDLISNGKVWENISSCQNLYIYFFFKTSKICECNEKCSRNNIYLHKSKLRACALNAYVGFEGQKSTMRSITNVILSDFSSKFSMRYLLCALQVIYFSAQNSLLLL